MKAASVILVAAICAAIGTGFGFQLREAWDNAVAAAASRRAVALHDCTMPCPIPEDAAMRPDNPKGKKK
jgi:hypothetical protein